MKKERIIGIEKLNAKIALNSLTFTRVIGAALMLPIYLSYGALTTALTAGILTITDFIDGKVARGFKIQTMLGSILDGISDKCLGIICLIILSFANPIFILPIGMELAISVVNYCAYKNNTTNRSRELGRLKAWPLGIGIFMGLLTLDIPGLKVILASFGVKIQSLSAIMNYINDSILSSLANIPLATFQGYIVKTILAFQTLALADYTLNVIREKKNQPISNDCEYEKKSITEVTHDLLDTDYYLENRDKPLKLVLMKKKSN